MRFGLPGVAAALAVTLAFAAEEPEAVYAKFHRAVLAGDFAEMARYGSAAKAAESAAMPAALRQASLELVRRLMPKGYSVAGKRFDPGGERVTLRLVSQAGAGGIATGTATLVREKSEWKVDEVNWGSGPAARSAAVASSAPASGAAQGRVNGAHFAVEKARLSNSILTLRQGKDFFADAEFSITLFEQGKMPDGKTFRIGPNDRGFIVSLSTQPGGSRLPQTQTFFRGYSMTLEFERRAGNAIRGRIDLRLPDKAQSFVSGSFEAEIR
jgi:hypothetical protein